MRFAWRNASEPGLVEKSLGLARIVNCATPAYLARYGHPRSLEELKTHRLIHYTQTFGATPATFEFSDGEKSREIKMRFTLAVNNTEAYKAACLAGLGIAQMFYPGVRDLLRDGKLVEVLPEHLCPPMPMKLIYNQKRLQTRRVRIFMTWLESVVVEFLRDP